MSDVDQWEWELTAGDTYPPIELVVDDINLDTNWELTGASITLVARHALSGTEVRIDGEVADGVNRLARVPLDKGTTLDVPGDYFSRFIIQYPPLGLSTIPDRMSAPSSRMFVIHVSAG